MESLLAQGCNPWLLIPDTTVEISNHLSDSPRPRILQWDQDLSVGIGALKGHPFAKEDYIRSSIEVMIG